MTTALATLSGIGPVVAAARAGVPVGFFVPYGLFASQWIDGAWTPPIRIAGYKPRSFSGSAETTAVRRDVPVTWRLPGSTAATSAAINAGGTRSAAFPGRTIPIGTTTICSWRPLHRNRQCGRRHGATSSDDLSMTKDIAMVAREGRLLVFRSGRARVRKASFDAGATQSSISCN